jgi:hypothetical protein
MRAKSTGNARDAGVIRMYTELANQWRELANQINGNKR